MKDALLINFRLRSHSWQGISVLVSLVLLLSLQTAAKAQDQSTISAPTSGTNGLASIDLVFCMETTYPTQSHFMPLIECPTTIIANIARRVIAQNSGRVVRLGIVPFCVPIIHNNNEVISDDPDLKLDLTGDPDKFLSVLKAWHPSHHNISQTESNTLEKEVMSLSWNGDSQATRKLYIVGNEHYRSEDINARLFVVTPGVPFEVSQDHTLVYDMWTTLRQSGTTTPETSRGIGKSTMFTDFVNHFAASLPGRRARVSMMLCGAPVNRGEGDWEGNRVRTIANWFEMGWPYRDGWIEDAARGGGEYIQYIVPEERQTISHANPQNAILWSRPESFMRACSCFLKYSPGLFAEEEVRRTAGKKLLNRLPNSGVISYWDRDPVLPVLTFFAQYPEAQGIPIH